METVDKKLKKEKKRKLREAEEAEATAAKIQEESLTEHDDVAALEKRARKKAKKEAKLQKEKELADLPASGADADASTGLIDDTSGDGQKKRRKEKKNSDEVVEEGSIIKKGGKSGKPSSLSNEIENNKRELLKFEESERDEGSLYVPHDATSAMTEEDVSSYRTGVELNVFPEEDSDKFKPITSFEYLNPSLGSFVPRVKAYLKEKNFAHPSAIQAQCWPPLLSGRDVVGIAMTGSGKTLAFLIPALLKIACAGPLNPNNSLAPRGTPTPRILVVAPTRELAMQSHQVVTDIGSLRGVCIYGGVPKPPQKSELRAGAEVVVATPGRLLDLMEEGALSLSAVRYLVLDEADRMLDVGFEPAIRKILAQCPRAGNGPKERQTAMFSATWPEEIRSLADTFLRHDVVRITVGSAELSANHRVKQIVECIEGYQKDRKLIGLLEKYHVSRKNRILVFVLYKKEAVTLQTTLQNKGYNVTAIHGDKGQNDRTAALEEFKSGRIPLLIATDVAARGLDIPQVEYVINYSFPLTVEDYVHRIGRTGRGGASGISHTFFTDFDKGLAGALVAVLQEANQDVPQDIYKYPMVTKKKTSKLYGDFGPKADLQGKKASKITFDD